MFFPVFFFLHTFFVKDTSHILWKRWSGGIVRFSDSSSLFIGDGCWQPVVTSRFGPKMAADNRLSLAILDQKRLLTTSHIFTVKWFKMVFHLIEFILICFRKILIAKANGQFYLCSCIFGTLCYIYMWTLSFLMFFFFLMDTNNVAFKFSPYLLPIVVHELLSNFYFTLPIFFF